MAAINHSLIRGNPLKIITEIETCTFFTSNSTELSLAAQRDSKKRA